MRVSQFGRAWLSAGAAVIISACATGQASTYSPRTGSTGHLESGEVRNARLTNLYDVILRLRPEWLHPRGGPKSIYDRSRQRPVLGVFIEGEGRGYTIEKLFEIPPELVKSIRRLEPSEAMAYSGPQWAWGGIMITLAR